MSRCVKKGNFQILFIYFHVFYTHLKANNCCQLMDLNPGHLVLEATALSTVPQPLPVSRYVFREIHKLWLVDDEYQFGFLKWILPTWELYGIILHRIKCICLEMGHPWPLFIYFCHFKQTLQFLQQYMWNMSILYMVLGFEPTNFRTWVSTHNN